MFGNDSAAIETISARMALCVKVLWPRSLPDSLNTRSISGRTDNNIIREKEILFIDNIFDRP